MQFTGILDTLMDIKIMIFHKNMKNKYLNISIQEKNSTILIINFKHLTIQMGEITCLAFN